MSLGKSDEWVVVGEVAGAYGVRGEIRVHNYSEAPEILLDVKQWFLQETGQWRSYAVISSRLHGRCVVGKLAGIDDRDVAARWRNVPVALRREDLPVPEAGEFYWTDLEGMTVINREHVTIGRVIGLMRTPANDVLRVQTLSDKEMLLPFIQSAVDRVDSVARIIHVDWGADRV